MLAGCAQNAAPEQSQSSPTQLPTDESAVEQEKPDEPPGQPESSNAEVLRVTIVCAGGLGDRSFYDSANEGLERLSADYGVTGKVLECKEDPSQYKDMMLLAAQNSDVVIPVGWQMGDVLAEIAPDFPDVKFIYVDEAVEGQPNVMNIKYVQNEGSFLVGYIAAKMSQTGVIGAVGGTDSATINDFFIGYQEGAKYANPDIKIETIYAEDYEDPAKGKECALSLFAKGCDIVYAVAGKTGEGVFQAAAESGTYAIGVDSDQKYINPDVIICSMLKRVGQSLYDTISGVIEGDEFRGGQTIYMGIPELCIGVGYGTEDMTQQVSDELKAEVEALQQKIVSGEITVSTARQ